MQISFGTKSLSSSKEPFPLRYRVAPGAGLTLLLHVLLLFFILRHSSLPLKISKPEQEGTLVLLHQASKAAKISDKPKREQTRPRRQPVRRPKPPSSPPEAIQPVVEATAPVPAPPPPQADPDDMLAMINAKREARRQAGIVDTPSANEIATANLKRDIDERAGRRPGTNGVFEILHEGPRMATFSFLGWRDDARRNWKQVIEVDAGPTGDVELAIVQRMIALIRTHYQGDFNWDSHRLGRVIVMSARPEDNAELERFLMQEFFPVR